MNVQWLKRKYRPMPNGGTWWAPKYPHNNNHGRRYKRQKTGKTEVFDREKVLVLRANGKRSWEWREISVA